MEFDLITKDDLASFKTELFDEMNRIFTGDHKPKKWLKSRDVCELLNCSPGTLQNLRIQSIIEYTKIGGSLYYLAESIDKVLEENKRNVA